MKSLLLLSLWTYATLGSFIMLVTIAPLQSQAQDKHLLFEHFSAKNDFSNNILSQSISSQSGLSHSSITCLLQDKEGFLWIGTRDGLNRFDGYNCLTFEHNPQMATSISNNSIQCLYEDRQGNIWVGTASGLNKYDKIAQTFKTYHTNPLNPQSLSHNDVRSIYQDQSGTLWIGTYVGLNRFNPSTNLFTLYEHAPGHANKWAYNMITEIREDRSGHLWLGTSQGLSLFDRTLGRFTRFSFHTSADLNPQHVITDILEDHQGALWVATSGDGLLKFDRKTRAYKVYTPSQTNIDQKNSSPGNSINRNISSQHILSLFEDTSGILWIGTQDKGLTSFDPKRERFTEHRSLPVTDITITTIYQDRSRVLWVGTYLEGLYKVDLMKKKFYQQTHHPQNPNTLRAAIVTTLYQDRQGKIWIGNNKGIDKLDPKNGQITHFTYPGAPPKNLWENNANCIYQDQEGYFWIGLHGGGLKRFDSSTNQFITYSYNPSDPAGLPNGIIGAIHQTKDGTLWLGTRFGLTQFDQKTKKFTTYRPASLTSLQFDIRKILEDHSGRLTVATAGHEGLYSFDPLQKRFISIGTGQVDSRRLQSGQNDTSVNASATERRSSGLTGVNTVYQDQRQTLWIGSASGGLYYLNHQYQPAIRPVTGHQILTQTIIEAILEDNSGNLWLSTRKNGLLKFNPATQTLHVYTTMDGLQSNEFNGAALKSAGGQLYFGGKNGITIFNSDSIRNNPYPPAVVITSFKVFDKPRNISAEITLPYSDNFFSFEFAALSYALPARNQYAYQLVGVDNDWVHSGTRRYASYTRLSPGEYIFKVKAANHDGVWNNKGTSIKIVITPPFWRTTWAYLFYSLTFMGILVGLRHYIIYQQRLRHQLLRSSLESEKLMELDKLKSEFFISISHELRTPLTLILSPIEQNLDSKNIGSFDESQVRLMHRNAHRLLTLLTQLLDSAKITAGKMKVNLGCQDIIAYLQTIVLSFRSVAERQRIALKFESEHDSLLALFDQDKLEKIVSNLLSNALKFTLPNGEITLKISVSTPIDNVSVAGSLTANPGTEHRLILQVTDTGIGLAPEQLPKIFDRFYQIANPLTENHSTHSIAGIGVGLALAKELVELQQGNITVTSIPGKGTCFTVDLPLSVVNPLLVDSHLELSAETGVAHTTTAESTELKTQSTDFSGPTNLPGLQTSLLQSVVDTDSESEQSSVLNQAGQALPLLLLIEDSEDLRQYLKSIFQNKYQITEAINGKDGWHQILELLPDLVISDWMMPEMDGVTLCHQLKTDQRTCHIPFVLLTAKGSVQSTIEGLETGADQYISKPFHPNELLIRVENLLEQQNRLRTWWSRNFMGFSVSTTDIEADQLYPANLPTEGGVHDQVALDSSSQMPELNADSPHVTPLVNYSHSSRSQTVSSLNALDEKFLQYVMQIIEDNLADTDFGIEKLEKQVGMSHTQFNRKLKALTNQSPSEFLRHYRLRKAATLLTERECNVSEVAFQVGFSNLSYFTKCFRQVYGITPSSYATNQARGKLD